MNSRIVSLTLLLAATALTPALAAPDATQDFGARSDAATPSKTREQVQAETREAMRLGLIPVDDVGRRPRDIYINAYPPLSSDFASMDASKTGTARE